MSSLKRHPKLWLPIESSHSIKDIDIVCSNSKVRYTRFAGFHRGEIEHVIGLNTLRRGISVSSIVPESKRETETVLKTGWLEISDVTPRFCCLLQVRDNVC